MRIELHPDSDRRGVEVAGCTSPGISPTPFFPLAHYGDTQVKAVSFQNRVEYYAFDGATPANGPDKDPLNNDLGAGGDTDGITLGSNTLVLSPDGTCDTGGSIIVFYPDRDDFDTLRADPYAVVVDSTATGRIVLQRWRREKQEWARK